MGNVDVSDQLRNTYRFDHWLQKRKWWWSILFWWIGVMLVNAYLYYVAVNLAAGLLKHKILSHHDFRKSVALAWINQPKYWTPKKQQQHYTGPNMSQEKKTGSSTKQAIRKSKKRMATNILLGLQKSGRRAHITNAGMSEHGGYADSRLNRAFCHFLISVKGRVCCAIHRWCNFEKLGSVVECEDCKVVLCISCYKMFHTCQDIMAKKDELREQFL
jgi:hypothetical protein